MNLTDAKPERRSRGLKIKKVHLAVNRGELNHPLESEASRDI